MSFKEIIEKEKNEIITTSIKQGNANRTIDYSQFLSLYAQYKEIMSEEEFAKILGINHEALRNYYDVGYTNTEAIEKVSTEMNLEIEEIYQDKINKIIQIEDFKIIYEKKQKERNKILKKIKEIETQLEETNKKSPKINFKEIKQIANEFLKMKNFNHCFFH